MTVTPAGSESATAPTQPADESPLVLKGLNVHPSEDYARLRAEGIEHIERLGHRLWTDYNVHDPGITLLELACYAITDVGYRARYPMVDLLADDHGDRPDAAEHRFHTALDVLTCHPVTFDDLRKRLVDIPGVRNAWVERNDEDRFAYWVNEEQGVLHQTRPATDVAARQNPPLNGLFDVLIEYEDNVAARQPIQIEPRAPLTSSDFIDVADRAMRFDAPRSMRLVAVSVYANGPGTIVVTLSKAGQVVASTSHEAGRDAERTRVPLDFDVPAGNSYRLDCEGSTVELRRDARRPIPDPGDRPVRFTTAEWRDNPTRGHNFFYDLEVDYAAEKEESTGAALTRQSVRNAVYDRLQSDRNLGEDIVAVRDAAREEIALCADVELTPDADVEAVVAEIFTILQLHVSPTVDFLTLDEMRARGKTVDEIFEGPVLQHGFIDDDQFRAMARLCEIRTSDVIDLIMQNEYVQSVRSASLLSFVDGELRTAADWLLPLATDRYRAPVFSSARSKLVMYKDGLPYYPSRTRLSELLEATRPTTVRGKLFGAELDLPVPVGRPRSVSRYYPMQNELPANYFAGDRKVPESLGLERHAQSKQLKAFLMLFEQMLANHLSQLAHIGDLFSWDPAALRTHFTQPVGPGEQWTEEIFAWSDEEEGRDILDELIESDDEAATRRDTFLNHLIGRFAEDFTEYSLLMYSSALDGDHADVLADKRRFLEHYPEISSRRGSGFDTRAPGLDDGSENLTGLQRRVYGLLGFDDRTRRRFARTAVAIVDDGDEFRFQIDLDGTGTTQFVSISCESRESTEALVDLALTIGGDRDNYRDAADDRMELVVREGDTVCAVIGTVTADRVDDVVAEFAACAEAEGFHVIEHVLARPRRANDQMMSIQLADSDSTRCIEAHDPYTFRATIVLPSWPSRFQNTNFRRLVERTLRREAPAHVLLKICWITHDQMRDLEDAYTAWSDRLADLVSTQSQAEREAATDGYSDVLAAMIDQLEGLVNVYPIARLHDPNAASGDTPAVTLNHTSLGTF